MPCPLYITPFRVNSCVISAAPVKTLSSFIPQNVASQNTWRWWLFCFWILVNIFHSAPSGWSHGTTYDEELLTIFVQVWYLFTLQKEVGGGRGGCVRHSWNSPELECKQREGEGPHLRVWVSRPTSWRTQDFAGKAFETWFQINVVPTHDNAIFFLWHIWQKHLLLCYSLASSSTQ